MSLAVCLALAAGGPAWADDKGDLKALLTKAIKAAFNSHELVTRGDQNLIEELGGKPAIERLQELAGAASEEERELLRRGLHVGLVVDEQKAEFSRGDFLVRNLLGADESSGALAVGEQVSVGQTVQFHVRDAGAADEDLREMLTGVDAEAALLFTCNGRGRHLFTVPDHDAGMVESLLGPIPLAGAFCAGERPEQSAPR